MEKMHTKMKTLKSLEEKERLQAEMIALDRKATDCQILIFHWIKSVSEEAKKIILESKKDNYVNVNASIIPGLVNKEYDFLNYGVYQNLIDAYGKERYQR
jgi:hypothetical protein